MTVVERLRGLSLAARPSQLALIALVYALGVGMERALAGAPGVPWLRVAAGAALLVPVAASVHYANEYVDVETDRLTERTAFSGGSGAVERTGITRAALARASAAALAAGVVGSVAVRLTRLIDPAALALLAAIAAAGLAYSLPPTALIRRGVGELTNAALGGLLLPLYGVAVVGRLTLVTVLAVVPFTLIVGCNLLATHWPDREADATVGKRTLAVRWSPGRLRRAYWTLAALAALSTVGLLSAVPTVVVAAQALAVPFLLWGGVALTRQRSPFPAVASMVVHAGASAAAWWWLALS